VGTGGSWGCFGRGRRGCRGPRGAGGWLRDGHVDIGALRPHKRGLHLGVALGRGMYACVCMYVCVYVCVCVCACGNSASRSRQGGVVTTRRSTMATLLPKLPIEASSRRSVHGPPSRLPGNATRQLQSQHPPFLYARLGRMSSSASRRSRHSTALRPGRVCPPDAGPLQGPAPRRW